MLRKWFAAIPGGTLRIAIALVLVVGASALFWASRDYKVIAPDWDGQVRGITYNPSHLFTLNRPSTSRPSASTATWRSSASSPRISAPIRCPSGLDRVPEIARRYGMTVSLGIWIGPDLEANKKEIDKAIKVALANRAYDRSRLRRQ